MIQTIVGLARRALSPLGPAGAPGGAVLPGTRTRALSKPGGGGHPDDAEDVGEEPARGAFARLLGAPPGGAPASSSRATRAELEEDAPERRHTEGAAASQETAVWAPPGPTAAATAALPASAAPPSAQEHASAALQELWPLLVRRVAWEGDGQRGAMRLELGAGSLSGATLLLRCDGGRVHVSLSDPSGSNLDAWRARIGARLAAAGLDVDPVE